jgi:hypothetical protein
MTVKEVDNICMAMFGSIETELRIAKRMLKKAKDEKRIRYLRGKIYGLTLGKNALWRVHVSLSFEEEAK